MDPSWKPTELFVKMSPPIAAALAGQWVTHGAVHEGLEGRAALAAAWASLDEAARHALQPALARLHDLCARQARRFVLDQARESRRDADPFAGRVLDAISTPDLAVRLYLDDPAALERAHFQYATALLEQVTLYQGQYIADVVPSHDRRARMLHALHAQAALQPGQPALEVADFVSDDRFVLALHRFALLPATRSFDAARKLDPDLCQPEVEVGLLFRFDSSMLIVKAKTCLQRAALRDAFLQIFVGDRHYFDTPHAHRPRFRLSIDAAFGAPPARPSLVKVASRSRPLAATRDIAAALRR